MKVTVIGSHLCPDTLYALNKLVEAKADITFQNLSASLPDLKAYLALRESSPVFEGPKARGSLGIPCFVREDGTVTLELEQVLSQLTGQVSSADMVEMTYAVDVEGRDLETVAHDFLVQRGLLA